MDKNKDLQIYLDLDRKLRLQDSSPEKIKHIHLRILKLSKTRADASYIIIGKLHRGSNEFQKSLLSLKKATIINPKNKMAPIYLSNSCLNLGKKTECFFTIQRALSILPKEPGLHSSIIKILKERKQLDDLLPFYHETAEMIKNNNLVIDLYLKSAEILEKEKMIPQAFEQYKKASETNTLRFDHYIQYANALVRHGLSEEAIVQFEHVLKLDPTNSLAMDNIASLHYELGRSEKAFQVLEEIIKNGLQTDMTSFNLSLVLEDLDRDEEVIKKYRDRVKWYIERNRGVMQYEFLVELRRVEKKLKSDIDEKAKEFYTKKLKALRVMSTLFDS